ncbi:MAG: sulfatase [Bacteroidota bacterium]
MIVSDYRRALVLVILLAITFSCGRKERLEENVTRLPNILFAISDDQSYPYASAYGTSGVNTPAFDKVAKMGLLLNNAFVAAPQCSPSRAAILTGRNIWQLEEAGTHSSYFPKKFTVFTQLLEENGFHVGYTGKPWGPGNWKDAGWKKNPVGKAYHVKQDDSIPPSAISKTDYFENFKDFYSEKSDSTPFFFWFGAYEPHRPYQFASGFEAGKSAANTVIPDFLPNDSIVQKDVADYALEIEWFDQHLGKMLAYLEENGELENTIIVVTADNGMPFPYAKANLQEYGTHVPMAIAWANQWKGNRVSNELVSTIDLAPTFLDYTGIKIPTEMTGKSMKPLLEEGKAYRDFVLTGRERHTHARPDNLAYPARAVRTADYLYIRNFKPDRWPAGDPRPNGIDERLDEGFRTFGVGYADIDGSPTKTYMFENQEEVGDLFKLGFLKRPKEQLFHIKNDPHCLYDLAENSEYLEIRSELALKLDEQLLQQKDPRAMGNGDIFESYPRFAVMRNFSGFKERGAYNKAFVKERETSE